MTVKLSPQPWLQFLDANGDPYSGAQLFVYAAGSTTKLTPYTDNTQTSQHTNPIILNSKGIPPSPVWLVEGLSYKFVLAPSDDTDPPAAAIATYDNLKGVNDANLTIDQWVASGLTPTYVSATSFTVPGDQTTDLHVGRRLKMSVTAGTVYGTIATTAYTSLTTVTVTMDSGSIDSGISSVSWGLLTATNHSIPEASNAISLGMMQDNSVDSDQYVDGSIDTAHIADNQVTLAKMAGGTAGHLISYDGSGDPQTETYSKWYRVGEVDLTNGGSNDTASWTLSNTIQASGLPDSVTAARIILKGVSLNGADEFALTLVDGGGEETSGYAGATKQIAATPTTATYSSYFQLTTQAAASNTYDCIFIDLQEIDPTNFTWAVNITSADSGNTQVECGTGYKSLSATLTDMVIKSTAGANFDAGTAYLYVYGNADV